MNLAPLLLAAGGLYWFANRKPKVSSSKSSQKSYKLGDKEFGYEIFNCDNLIIYDTHKAFTYAHTMGVNEATASLINKSSGLSAEKLLLGNCFEQYESEYFQTKEEKEIAKQKAIILIKKLFNTKEKIKFIFEMFKHFYSGFVKVDPDQIDIALANLNKMKNTFSEIGFDVSNLIVVLY